MSDSSLQKDERMPRKLRDMTGPGVWLSLALVFACCLAALADVHTGYSWPFAIDNLTGPAGEKSTAHSELFAVDNRECGGSIIDIGYSGLFTIKNAATPMHGCRALRQRSGRSGCSDRDSAVARPIVC
ncbi:MAG: hypothetical protein A2Z18_07065 [Armatimonadetes bacterium RBG_16_58_9]|nr:MAG: hypothetical protein A2Z18_07065 [Armatimonadetes bacterium RBG_16_58_9]